jgi:hypothetical protein
MTSSGVGVQTMRGYRPWNLMPWLAGVALLAIIAPARATAQAQEIGPTPASLVDSAPVWGESSLSPLPSSPGSPLHGPQSQSGRSATRIIVTNAAVGTGAGLLIGLALSGADVSDDRTSVVVTWTALGLTAGLVAGAIAWFVE